MNNCKTCIYSTEGDVQPGTLTRQTVCRRYPPQVVCLITPQGAGIMSTFPSVTVDMLCGEYKNRANIEPPDLKMIQLS